MPFTPAPTPGNDQINGPNITGNDSVDALAGNDTVNAVLNGGMATIFGDFGDDTINVSGTGTAVVYGEENADKITVANDGNTTIYGGRGVADSTDGTDVINTSGKGAFLVYANAGSDTVTYTGSGNATDAFFSGAGDDTLTYTRTGNAGGTLFAEGGTGADKITIESGGAVTVTGGRADADPSDGADIIKVGTAANGLTTGLIYGNAGNDQITLVVGTALGNSTDVYGGRGDDTITITETGGGTRADLLVYGNTGADKIDVTTNGVVTIFGGNQNQDTVDGADQITVAGAGTSLVYGNADADILKVTLTGAATTSVFGGLGNDDIDVLNAGANTGSALVYGGDNADTIDVTTAGSAVIFGGSGAFGPADGKDTITVHDAGALAGAQTFVIYGNAGDDTIKSTAALLQNDTEVFVYGGKGADTFDFVNNAGGKEVTYVYNVPGGSGFNAATSTGFDVINNYLVAVDEIDLRGAVKGAVTSNVGPDDKGSLADNVNFYSQQSNGTNSVVTVFDDQPADGILYVLVDNSLGTFNEATDILIEVRTAATAAELSADLLLI